jgi:hypothetical protein
MPPLKRRDGLILHYLVNGERFETDCLIMSVREILNQTGYDPNEYYLMEVWQVRDKINLDKLRHEANVFLKDDIVFYARLMGPDDEKSACSSGNSRTLT